MAFTPLASAPTTTGPTPGFKPLGSTPAAPVKSDALFGGLAGNLVAGATKGIATTAKEFGTLGQALLNQTAGRAANLVTGKGNTPTSGPLFPTATTATQGDVYTPGTPASTAADAQLKTQGAAQGVGYGVEKLGELLTPTGIEKTAAQTTAKVLPYLPKIAAKVTPFISRSVAAGVDQGAKGYLGSGDTGTGVGFGVAGALSPTIGAGLALGKTVAGSTASGIIGSLIKPLSKTFSYGHDPIRGVLNEGIIGNDFDAFAKNLQASRQAVGQSIASIGQQVTNKGITSDFTPVLAPLARAMQDAARNNNPTLLQSLNNVKIALSHSLGLATDEAGNPTILKGEAKDLTKLSYEQGQALLDDITSHTRYTGNPSDDKAINQATQEAYRAARETLNGMAASADPALGTKIKDLNQRYGDLSAAQTAVNNRDIALKRQNYISLAGKIGLGGTAAYAVAHGLLTGDWAGTAKVLVADVGLGLLAKAGGSTAVETRLAQFLNKLGPAERDGLLSSSPMLRTVYQRFTGDFGAPPKSATLPAAAPLKPVQLPK